MPVKWALKGLITAYLLSSASTTLAEPRPTPIDNHLGSVGPTWRRYESFWPAVTAPGWCDYEESSTITTSFGILLSAHLNLPTPTTPSIASSPPRPSHRNSSHSGAFACPRLIESGIEWRLGGAGNSTNEGCCTKDFTLTTVSHTSLACCPCGATCTGAVPKPSDWYWSRGQLVITSSIPPGPVAPPPSSNQPSHPSTPSDPLTTPLLPSNTTSPPAPPGPSTPSSVAPTLPSPTLPASGSQSSQNNPSSTTTGLSPAMITKTLTTITCSTAFGALSTVCHNVTSTITTTSGGIPTVSEQTGNTAVRRGGGGLNFWACAAGLVVVVL
jgi:hypothetical protein